jgi:hypothetical protein
MIESKSEFFFDLFTGPSIERNSISLSEPERTRVTWLGTSTASLRPRKISTLDQPTLPPSNAAVRVNRTDKACCGGGPYCTVLGTLFG